MQISTRLATDMLCFNKYLRKYYCGTKKYHYSAKKLLPDSKHVWYPENIGATKWLLGMINNFKIYIICCMAFVVMAAFRILNVARVSIRKELRGFASTIVLTRNMKNPGILASSLCSSAMTTLPYSDKQDISRFFVLQSSLISARDIFVTKLRKWTIYEGVLNRLSWRKYHRYANRLLIDQNMYDILKSI
jgi:hypothetical protein